MHIFRTQKLLIDYLSQARLEGKKIGFVPTMGALHEGHLSLYKKCKIETDLVVASIFVNPIQFNNATDLALYPREEAQDIALLESAGCNVLFAPDVAEMYPSKLGLQIEFSFLDQIMEGKHRPGHFSGVAIVVAKLFNIVQPHMAYFGQKDLQQFAVINQLVKTLSYPIQLVRCDIVREKNGLAMSSRNKRLSEAQKSIASNIYQSLLEAKNMIERGEYEQIEKVIVQYYEPNTALRLEYFQVVDADTLEDVNYQKIPKNIAICVACYLGEVRLIDNIICTIE
jgi:pantoate--beta-alanine ligase